MNKLFKFFLTSAAISAALVGVVSCQKDFAPDIESLNKKVAELTQKLNDLQAGIASGEIVTNVTTTAGGITVTTNKGTYNITNGKDGKDGTNGKDGVDGKDGKDGKDGANGKDGSVVTIGENGNWFIDGVDTGLAAAGKDGKDGKDGVDGKDGANGKDGVDGKDGKDGVDGKDGKDGKDGENGKDGKDGKDGQNGEYYVPNTETGFFTKYTWDATKGEYVATPTEISFLKPGAITAVWDTVNNQLIFSGVEGKEGPVVISLLAEVKSLVFMPNTYIDGVEALVFDNFHYFPEVIKNLTKDSAREYAVIDTVKWLNPKTKKEEWIKVDSVDVQPAILAQYHVNPTNADLSFLKEGSSDFLSFVVVPNANKIETKAKASEDFAVTPIFKSFENGVLTVEVNVVGTPADDEYLSVMALNIEKASGEFVTSDYAMLQKNELDDLVIAFKNSWAKDNLATAGEAKDAHLRRALKDEDFGWDFGISEIDDEAYIDDSEVWTKDELDFAEAQAVCDISVKYDSSIDLKTIVAAHTLKATPNDKDKELTAADLERLGLTFAFEVVKNYRIGTKIDPSLTDQADFVTLEDGVFTPKVFSTAGVAAVGRTPIIRVALKHGDDVVSYAYLKVFISNREDADFDAEYDFDDTFGFACGTADSLLTTVQYMNEKVYNEVGLPALKFHALYNLFDNAYMGPQIPNPKKPSEMIDPWVNVGTVEDIVNSESQGTHILKWKISAEDAWKYAGKEIEHYVAYYNNSEHAVKAIIRLVAKVDGIQKEYNVLPADYISNFWNAEKTATRYNVAVPSSDKDEDSTHCVFVNEINYSFETWRSDDEAVEKNPDLEGLIKLAPYVTRVDYFFCNNGPKVDGENTPHDLVAPKIDGKDVVFEIVDDTVLTAQFAKAAAWDTIAVINNHPESLLNTITLNKKSSLAKALLNTKQLYVNIGAKGYVCGDENKAVKISFNGQDHFRADYVRPINISDIARDNYIDGVSYGEKGSYIRIEDLISPSDWRSELDSKKWIAGAEYGKNRQFSNYPNFWGYYGPFEVDVDLANVKCDLNGRIAAKPAYLQIDRKTYEDMADIITDKEVYKKLAKSNFGYITYKNNGQVISTAFNLFMNVTVKYGWGYIEVKDVKVPVSTTIEE